MKSLRLLTIIGNILFIFWIVYNGIDEGAIGVNRVEAAALTCLVILLVLNTVLLLRRRS